MTAFIGTMEWVDVLQESVNDVSDDSEVTYWECIFDEFLRVVGVVQRWKTFM